MPPHVRLKPVSIRNREQTQKLVRFINRHYPSPIPLRLSDLTSKPVRYFWAISGGEIVGCSAFVEKTQFLVETIKTVVHADYRGKGFGEAISAAIETEVARRGYRKILTTIYTTNLPMIFIKLKQGYRFEGFHPNHEKPGLDEYSFGKELKA